MGRSDRWTDACRTSAVVDVLTRVWSRSVAAGGKARETGALIDYQVTQASTAVEGLSVVGDVLEGWFDRSILGTVVVAVSAALRSSYVLRWLTAEPETDVIVIDLNDSIVLRPFLRTIDEAADTFHAHWRGSVVYGVSDRIAEFVADTPVRALSLVILSMMIPSSVMAFAVGSLSTVELYPRLMITLLALLGTRSGTSLDDLRETRTAKFIRAIVEPPDTQEPGTRSTDQHLSRTGSLAEEDGEE